MEKERSGSKSAHTPSWRNGTGRVPALLAVVALIAGCRPEAERKGQSTTATGPVRVETMTVDVQRTTDIVDLTGTIRAVKTATISARVMALVERVHVHAGDVIGFGTVLAELDERALRAEFDQTRLEFEQIKALFEKQAATRAEFDAAEARYREAETALAHAKITAPFDGVVTHRSCEPGVMASPGKPLFEMEQPTAFRFEVEVPERHHHVVNLGKAVHVVVGASGEKCVGRVGEIAPVADASSQTLLVKIDLTCRQPVESGQLGRAELIVGERFGMFVTRGALHQHGQLSYVYVVEQNQVRLRLVHTGRAYLDLVEILSGLSRGDRVVTKADGDLADGTYVSF